MAAGEKVGNRIAGDVEGLKMRRFFARGIHTGRKGCTFVYQASMPRLPLPELEKTTTRWLEAVTPLMTPQELPATETAIRSFATEGKDLHEALKKRDTADLDNSFINEWWKDMYLKDMRDPLPINVNPYLQLVDDPRCGGDQVVRAASLVESAVRFWRALQEQTLEPDVFHMGTTAQQPWFKTLVTFLPRSAAYYAAYLVKSYPLDMAQYPWLFATSRQAHPERDVLFTDSKATHIAVMAHNRVFRLSVESNPSQAELQEALGWIVAQSRTAPLGVGSLTALDRDAWASVRPRLVNDSGDSLKTLEGALFALCLDAETVTDASSAARVFLHGRNDRWYDKSLQLIVSRNGRAAINFEHSWGDGVSVLRFANEVVEDTQQNAVVPKQTTVSSSPPALVQELAFNLKGVHQACAEGDEWLRKRGQALTSDELRVQGLGKSFFKSHKVAPDGVVQNVIQLAYARAFGGGPVATYESASTAGFRKGRTETIRPATVASANFVKAALDPNGDTKNVVALLRKAADVHRANSTLAAIGQGMDRHLFALRQMALAKGGPLPAIFSDPSYARMSHNVLSTSTLVSPFLDGGGFGPVVADGFGVGYGTTDNGIAFAITTYRGRKDMDDFLAALQSSLNDVRDMLNAKI